MVVRKFFFKGWYLSWVLNDDKEIVILRLGKGRGELGLYLVVLSLCCLWYIRDWVGSGVYVFGF